MTWVRVSQSEFDRIRKLAAEKKAKREEKRKALPWGAPKEPEPAKEKKPRKKRRKKGLREIQWDKNDSLASAAALRRDLIKYGPICRMCGKERKLEWYHLVRKARSCAIRWLPENIIAGCSPCNGGEFFHPSLYRDKHIALVGKPMVEAIEARAREGAKYTYENLVEIGRWLKALIETAPGLPEPPRPSCLPPLKL